MTAVELHVVAGPAAGRRLEVGRGIVFGRGAEAEGLGNDPELSRTHARIRVRGQALELEDLGSTNGTRVNGEPVSSPIMISPGDRIALWSPNSHHWVTAALGAHYAGAVLVPINTRYTGYEAADILWRTGARALVVAGRFLRCE